MLELAERVRSTVAASIGVAHYDLRYNDDLFDHGADELDVITVAMDLEEKFGLVRLDEEVLRDDRTVSKCVELVHRGLQAQSVGEGASSSAHPAAA
jgi:acyl carrier protein